MSNIPECTQCNHADSMCIRSMPSCYYERMNNKAEALMPCPFCGGDDVYISSHRTGEITAYMVACSDCPGMASSCATDFDEVIKAWNTRNNNAVLDEVKEAVSQIEEDPIQNEDDFISGKYKAINAIDNLRGTSDE